MRYQICTERHSSSARSKRSSQGFELCPSIVGMTVGASVLVLAAAIAGDEFALPQRGETWTAWLVWSWLGPWGCSPGVCSCSATGRRREPRTARDHPAGDRSPGDVAWRRADQPQSRRRRTPRGCRRLHRRAPPGARRGPRSDVDLRGTALRDRRVGRCSAGFARGGFRQRSASRQPSRPGRRARRTPPPVARPARRWSSRKRSATR